MNLVIEKVESVIGILKVKHGKWNSTSKFFIFLFFFILLVENLVRKQIEGILGIKIENLK